MALDFSRGLGSERAYHRVPLPQLDPDANGGVRQLATNLHRGKITSAEDLRTIVEDMTTKKGAEKVKRLTSSVPFFYFKPRLIFGGITIHAWIPNKVVYTSCPPPTS
jgi:hypothetical protein